MSEVCLLWLCFLLQSPVHLVPSSITLGLLQHVTLVPFITTRMTVNRPSAKHVLMGHSPLPEEVVNLETAEV